MPVEAIWLAVEPVDGRLGIDGLSRRIEQTLGRSPCDGSAYGFCNRAGNRIKLVVWDRLGIGGMGGCGSVVGACTGDGLPGPGETNGCGG
jgi:hypothetical protein